MTKREFTQGIAVGMGLVALVGCGGSGGGITGTPSPSPSPSPSDSQRSILIRVPGGTDIAALAREYGCTVEDGVPEDNLYRLRLPSGQDHDSALEHFHHDSRFTDAESDEGVRAPEGGTVTGDPIHVPFDFVAPSDSRYVSLSSAYSSGNTIRTTTGGQIGLTVSRAFRSTTGITVAILDTGVQQDHPQLSSHLVGGYNAITPGAAPADIADGTTNQALGHGTMVAGVIAQVAPEAHLLPVRVLNADGSGTVFNVVRGLRWAISHGAQVVNLSLGTTTASRTLQAAIQDAHHAGVILVASAGNAGKERKDYPAGYSDTLAVGATDDSDRKASFSNFGSHITLSAPGTGITSTYIGGGFATWSGTSFAAPFVSGAAALVWAARPGLEGDKVVDALRKSARPIDSVNPGYAGKLGKGMLNVGAALSED